MRGRACSRRPAAEIEARERPERLGDSVRRRGLQLARGARIRRPLRNPREPPQRRRQGRGDAVTLQRLLQLAGELVHLSEEKEPLVRGPLLAARAERRQRRLRAIFGEPQARFQRRKVASRRRDELGPQGARLAKVLRLRRGRVGDEVLESAAPVGLLQAQLRPHEARLGGAQLHGAIDPRRHQRRGAARAPHLCREIEQALSVTAQRLEGGVGNGARERILRRGRLHERRRVQNRRGEELAGALRRRGRGLLEQRPGGGGRLARGGPGGRQRQSVQACLRAGRGAQPSCLPGGSAGPGVPVESAHGVLGAALAQRNPRPQQPQLAPGRLERERLPQRLVGAVRLEKPALRGEDLAEPPPGRRVRGRELRQRAQLARFLVHPTHRVERARPQPVRRAPGRLGGAERIRRGERATGIALPQLPFSLRKRGRIGCGGPRLRPVFQLSRALLLGDAIEERPDASRLRRVGLERVQRGEPLARLRRAPDAALEVGHADGEAHLSPRRSEQEAAGEQGERLVRAFPAVVACGEQLGEAGVVGPA